MPGSHLFWGCSVARGGCTHCQALGNASRLQLNPAHRAPLARLWLVALMLHPCLLQFHDHLISPKEFVHLAGKSTLKDWKRAIRMNGIMLRSVPSSVALDTAGGLWWGKHNLWNDSFAAEGANEPL